MAKLFITEYTAFGTKRSETPVGFEPGTDQAPLAVGTVVASAAFAANTIGIRVHTDAICSILIGTPANGVDPVATINNKRLAANTTEYFGVKTGDKLSVIANT